MPKLIVDGFIRQLLVTEGYGGKDPLRADPFEGVEKTCSPTYMIEYGGEEPMPLVAIAGVGREQRPYHEEPEIGHFGASIAGTFREGIPREEAQAPILLSLAIAGMDREGERSPEQFYPLVPSLSGFGREQLLTQGEQGGSVTLQYEAGVYEGSADTYIYEHTTSLNYSTEDELQMREEATVHTRSLIVFGEHGIPPGAVVNSAILTLVIGNDANTGNPAGNVIRFHRVVRQVECSEATWDQPLGGESWSAPGCGDGVNDYDETDYADVDTSGAATDDSYDIDVTSLVASALQSSLPITFRVSQVRDEGYPNRWRYWDSNEYATVAYRPKLTVTYGGGGGEAVPRVTPTELPFGEVGMLYQREREVQIFNDGPASSILYGNVSVSGDSVFTITQGAGAFAITPAQSPHIVRVLFSPTAGLPYTGTLGTGISGVAAISLTGNGIIPTHTVQPTSLNFGDVSVGSYADLDIVVTSQDSRPYARLVVDANVVSSNYAIQAGGERVELGFNEQHTVTVRFSPVSSGVQTATVQMGGVVQNISCTGNGVGSGSSSPGPLIDVTPTSIDFGAIQGGQASGVLSFRVRNTGDAPATARVKMDTRGDDEKFTVPEDGDELDLSPQGYEDIECQFAPASGDSGQKTVIVRTGWPSTLDGSEQNVVTTIASSSHPTSWDTQTYAGPAFFADKVCWGLASYTCPGESSPRLYTAVWDDTLALPRPLYVYRTSPGGINDFDWVATLTPGETATRFMVGYSSDNATRSLVILTEKGDLGSPGTDPVKIWRTTNGYSFTPTDFTGEWIIGGLSDIYENEMWACVTRSRQIASPWTNVFRSTNEGSSWSQVGATINNFLTNAVRRHGAYYYCPGNWHDVGAGNQFLALNTSQVYRYPVAGGSWTKVYDAKFGSDPGLGYMTVSATYNGYLYMAALNRWESQGPSISRTADGTNYETGIKRFPGVYPGYEQGYPTVTGMYVHHGVLYCAVGNFYTPSQRVELWAYHPSMGWTMIYSSNSYGGARNFCPIGGKLYLPLGHWTGSKWGTDIMEIVPRGAS